MPLHLAPAAPAAPAAAAGCRARSPCSHKAPSPYPAGRWSPPTAWGRCTQSHPRGPHRCPRPRTGWRRTRPHLRRDGGGVACGRGREKDPRAAGLCEEHQPHASVSPSLLPGATKSTDTRGDSTATPLPSGPLRCPAGAPRRAPRHSPRAQVGPLQPDGQWHSKPEGTSWQEPPLAQGLEEQACSAARGPEASLDGGFRPGAPPSLGTSPSPKAPRWG